MTAEPGGTRRRLGLRARAARDLATLAGSASRLAGRGAGRTVPGRLVQRLWPQALPWLLADRPVVLVSGTNGKSTTTRLVSAALGAGAAVSNEHGDNLTAGIVTCLLADPADRRPAVLEVDERVLPVALAAAPHAVVVLLNLSRDQLDRYGEVALQRRQWAEAIGRAAGCRVVANADDPQVVAAVRGGRPDEEAVVWVSAGHGWHRDAAVCPFCGATWEQDRTPWSCDACGARAPRAHWRLTGDGVQDPAGRRHALALALPGRASRADACLALAAAEQLGVDWTVAANRLDTVTEVDGRYLRTQVAGRPVRLLLAKNPAGWLEVLEQLQELPGQVAIGINARTADGTDPSWLWDVPFEQLAGRRLAAFGERRLDLAVRLSYDDLPHVVAEDLPGALARLAPDEPVVVVANYTAFVQARAVLRALG